MEFLTNEPAYGSFAKVPMRLELERFFYLDDVDRDLVALRRTKSHQLGFAIQLTTVRYIRLFNIRLFLEDPLAVPRGVYRADRAVGDSVGAGRGAGRRCRRPLPRGQAEN
ncbi:DUF4158 domain-containing protein [Microtetraspora malaysiensis]|uniref:DUF4158 domain-containing protein n=1 Tax=Microtetraspora malaysiensis TaxID=161358 RepID=UPI00082A8C6D